MPANAIEIRGLEKAFPTFALGPLDLTVPCGAIYGFVGPNGAGKTTTIDLLFGMGAKDGGSITVVGLDHLRDEVAMKRQVAYVSPELYFQPWGRVHKVVQFVRGFYPTWDQAYCQRLMTSLDIHPDDRIATLSFGARIKLALILALAWKPKVLVLDEPTVGLDAISKQAVFAELLAAVQDEERTILISSHGLSDVERFADHLGMIKNGRLLFEGATADVIARFRMVDFIAADSVRVEDRPGVFVQQHDGRRWRVLLDLQRASLDWLRALGVTLVADAPVTLEELFIALGKA
jgi:ABC-type multidrug transport system ATPase subunit